MYAISLTTPLHPRAVTRTRRRRQEELYRPSRTGRRAGVVRRWHLEWREGWVAAAALLFQYGCHRGRHILQQLPVL